VQLQLKEEGGFPGNFLAPFEASLCLSHTYTLNFYFIGTLPGIIGIKELCESKSFSTSELLQALKKGHQFVRNDPSCRYGQVVFAEDDPGQRRRRTSESI